MVLTITLSGVICLTMILLVLFKPEARIKNFKFGTYWIATLIGAILLLALGCVPIKTVAEALVNDSAINPLKILCLFISMTVLSIFLDEAGFFKMVAGKAAEKGGGSQMRLFVALYVTISLLTVFTSNDIIILTFTPFICYFTKNAKIDPTPYLAAEFVAANTWSLMLVIGNPTNIYLATACGISFAEYTSVMALPTVVGGVVSFAILLLLFGKKLSQQLIPLPYEAVALDKGLIIIGLAHLIGCTVLLALSGYIGLEMWYVTLGFALSLLLCATVYKLVKKQKFTELTATLKRAPYELVPFVLSMFVLVLSLEYCGAIDFFVALLGQKNTVFSYGLTALLTANLVNNIPMSMLYSMIASNLSGATRLQAVYAAIAASNVGAVLTPVGALAGIMFEGLIKTYGVDYGFGRFCRYGLIVAIPTLLAVLGVILLTVK